MQHMKPPLVSVVTPVFNAEKYIEECVRSVLGQTYPHWEYIIVNNRSTDHTLSLVQGLTRRDPRVRIITNPVFVSQMANWNLGLAAMSPACRYCKVLHADDWMYPECLERMVEVGEKNTRAAVIGSYRLDEDRVNLDGIPPDREFMSGREVCRAYLLEKMYLFGSPSSLLLRSSIVRKNQPFYDPSSVHADTEACLRILKDQDFGFVHQVLTFTRRHNESASSLVNRFDTRRLERVQTIEKYGLIYLSPDEFALRRKRIWRAYHRFLARKAFELEESAYWRYHSRELRKVGRSMNPLKIFLLMLYQLTLPRETLPHLKKGLTRIKSGFKTGLNAGEMDRITSSG